MSKYTYQLRDVCESMLNRSEYADVDDVDSIVNSTVQALFSQSANWLSDNPYVNNYQFAYFRSRFFYTVAKMVLRRYYTREICAETVGLWKLWLNKKVIKLAEKYDPWYASINIDGLDLNALQNLGVIKVHTDSMREDGNYTDLFEYLSEGQDHLSETDNTTDSNSASDSNKTSVDLYPQSDLSGDNNYYSGVEKNISGNSNSYTDNRTRTESNESEKSGRKEHENNKHDTFQSEYTEKITGVDTNYSDIIARFKKSVHNIDVQLIDEFNDLFLGIY